MRGLLQISQIFFCSTKKRYNNLVGSHILKSLQEVSSPAKIRNRDVCMKYFQLLDNIRENQKSKYNMIFSASFQLQQLDNQRQAVCQMILNNQIPSQAQLDKVIKWVTKTIKNDNQISKKQIQQFVNLQEDQLIKFIQFLQTEFSSNFFKQSSTNNLCKQYREKFPEINNKQIFELVQKKKNSLSQQRQIKPIQSNKFWDKIKNIKPRLLKEETNSSEIYEQHLKITQGKLRFRFPPQPNGFLHIGHLKSIRMNFQTAKKVNGECFLRYDDTNPEKQTHQYIEQIQNNIKWMGYTPDQIKFTSDYFQEMMEFANVLIKEGHAYICESSQKQIEIQRSEKRANPYRDRPKQFSLNIFPNLGPSQTLRLKLDPAASNPTLRDPIIYRAKSAPHPRTKDKFKIYPMYDFAHCISDSLQHIDYSLCSLQFQVRRELYYRILHLLRLYKPIVWEFSRLNIEGSVISKRKIKDLIDNNQIQGWDDPRLLTIKGMQRRGYTPEMLNSFIDLVNSSRSGNQNYIKYSQLERQMKKSLSKNNIKLMAIINPIKINIDHSNDFKLDETYQLSYLNRIKSAKSIFIQQEAVQKLKGCKLIILKYIGVYEVIFEEQNTILKKSDISVEQAKKSTDKNISIQTWVSEQQSQIQKVWFYDQIINQDGQFNIKSKIQKQICISSEITQNQVDYDQVFLLERIGYFKRDPKKRQLICCAKM